MIASVNHTSRRSGAKAGLDIAKSLACSPLDTPAPGGVT